MKKTNWSEKIFSLKLKADQYPTEKIKMKRKPWEKVTIIIQAILESADLSLSHEHLMELLGDSRANIYKTVKPLVEGTDFTPPLLAKFSKGEKVFYKFASNIWSDLSGSNLESKFYLECYKHLGHLLQTEYSKEEIHFDDSNVTTKDLQKLNSKFFYLSKIQAKPYDKKQENMLNLIVKALLNENEIFLYYPKFDLIKSQKARRVKPLSLCQYRDDLYLIGLEGDDKKYDEKNIRTYKITRISDLVEGQEKYQYPPSWTPALRYGLTSGLIVGEVKKATLVCRPPFTLVLSEKNFMNAKIIEEMDDGEKKYELFYTDSNEFLGQLAVYAECVEIIEPQELREQFCQKLESGLKRHQSKKKAA